jgi:hypothetical protein
MASGLPDAPHQQAEHMAVPTSSDYKTVPLPKRSRPHMAHLYEPAVRCKRNVMTWRGLVLRICIRPVCGALSPLAIMDIRARSISIRDSAPKARWAT